MTDKSATELIRAMLDERGVEYTTEDMPTNKQTYWGDWCFMEPLDAKPHTLGAQCELMLIPATPEQAIAATLGSEPQSMRTFDSMETALSIAEKEVEIEELKRENAELCKENEELSHRRAELEAATLGSGKLTAEQVRDAIEANSWAETSTIREFSGSAWQAIADELNAALGSGMCELIDCGKFTPRHDFHRVKCSECGVMFWQAHGHLPRAKFCPNCGKAVSA